MEVEYKCETCKDTKEVDETLGGHARADPHAPCPDCTVPVLKLKYNLPELKLRPRLYLVVNNNKTTSIT